MNNYENKHLYEVSIHTIYKRYFKTKDIKNNKR